MKNELNLLEPFSGAREERIIIYYGDEIICGPSTMSISCHLAPTGYATSQTSYLPRKMLLVAGRLFAGPREREQPT